ncbi:MAG: phosphoenolpyruvate carboxykinase (ATP) [Holophagales bacterium]|jgi:phosphoenolpyruvate carboxykinase (ATP)|nr:phosphoenolpyruvate carboxykinase (ATP) [Holophagales bacterium]
MATIGAYPGKEIFLKIASQIRTTVETVFYGNNVKPVTTVAEAYRLAAAAPGTVVLDGMPVYQPEAIGLPSDAKVLLMNDGAVSGRAAAARRILGWPGINKDDLYNRVVEAIYQTRKRPMITSQALVGLEEDFMVRARLVIPEDHANILYSWLLNFQWWNEVYAVRYIKSKPYPEGDILVFSDPDWTHPEHPMGLSFFDPDHNTLALLGMRYFGEHKKGTLTLAWGIAARHGYVSCHGGLKRYSLPGNNSYVAAVFGLSGSGKSTITHARHDGKYPITVVHDDAFVINIKDKYSIALEPAYFDKTQDYPMDCEDNKFILTLQNNGATIYPDGKLCVVSEDLRNGNGRAVKSRLWSPDRVDRIDEPIDAIFWLMKDETLPPVIKLEGSSLASVFGATLATKRTSAERLAPGVDPNALVLEPYANPFRTYPLSVDYTRFKSLIEDGVACYVLNTGSFMGTKVKPADTLGILEQIVEKKSDFKPWGPLKGLKILDWPGFKADLSESEYRHEFAKRIKDRAVFVQSRETELGGADKLPPDALQALNNLLEILAG